MKRVLLSLVGLIAMTTLAFADNDKVITIDQLPATAKQFIATYFPDAKPSIVKMDSELFDKSYEVIFADGGKVEFDKKGEWNEVDCKQSQVPEGIVPQQIKNYIATNYKEAKVLRIERDSRDYEVKLSNKLELKFDLKFNLIDIDD